VLQALVRQGILKGVRGPRGGYELARERKRISIDDILKAAGMIEEETEPLPVSEVVRQVVAPAIAQAEKIFATALTRITIEDLVRRAEPYREAGGER
jgi:DNA-binding IscR family transcriptional regulator